MSLFSVIISEKGGAERRETFDRPEITVGRVQGNELILAKGNVSKRHARLLFRDGRFIVTDLKSTNGTYVNGRKIAQATIVREGDKIYIGDFVLRVESSGSGAEEVAASAEVSSSELVQAPPSAPQSPPLVPAPAASSPPSYAGTPPPRPVARQDVVSHFPLEEDPDERESYVVPGPPRIPTRAALPPGSGPSSPPLRPAPTRTPPTATPISSPPAPAASPSQPVSAPVATPVVAQHTAPPSPAPPASPSGHPASSGNGPQRRAATPERPPVERPDPQRAAAHRAAVARLFESVRARVDLGELDDGRAPSREVRARVDEILAHASGEVGDLPPGLPLEQVVDEARRELLDVGPLAPLLEDEEITEIQVVHHDYVLAMYGRRQVALDLAFTSEASLLRVVRRLAGGAPLGALAIDDESGEGAFLERRLPRGARLFARLHPDGHLVVIRKPQRSDQTLEDLVRSGVISRSIAHLLAHAVGARANVLVTGTFDAAPSALLGALAAAGSTEDRVVVLQEDDELVFNQPHVVPLFIGDSQEQNVRAVRTAVRMRADRVVVGAFGGSVAVELVDAIGDGMEGVLAAARTPTLRHAVARLPADIAATRPAVPVDTVREWLASAFDLVVEVAKLRDGRVRVVRVGELVVERGQLGVRDVFVFQVERVAAGGAVEGSFLTTGVVPALLSDLVARGVPFDVAVFKRNSVPGRA